MDRGLRERVRWGNVGLVAGVGAVLAVVVLWPVLASEAPRVPGEVAAPVATATPAPWRVRVVRPRRMVPVARAPRVREAPRRPSRAVVRVVRRAGGGAVPARPAPVATVAPPVAPAPAPAPAASPVPAPPDPDPALREFGPEGG